MITENGMIIASEGKVLRRKGTGEIFGREILPGYSHFIGGVRQVPPHRDTPDDFEEVDAPEDTAPEPDIPAEEALGIITGGAYETV